MKRILAIAYLLTAVVTFGHAWNRIEYPNPMAKGVRLELTTVCAAFWPFYWSALLFK